MTRSIAVKSCLPPKAVTTPGLSHRVQASSLPNAALQSSPGGKWKDPGESFLSALLYGTLHPIGLSGKLMVIPILVRQPFRIQAREGMRHSRIGQLFLQL